MIALGVIGYREFLQLAANVNPSSSGSYALVGYAVVVALGCAAYADGTAVLLLAITLLAVVSPLVLLFPRPLQPGGFLGWSLACTGSLYLGLPIYAAIATRANSGAIGAPWLTDVAERLSGAWDSAPRGLAWVLTVILSTWVGDSTALLAGRAIGTRKLARMISPNKSQEGALASLIAAMTVGAVSVQGFGLGDWRLGVVAGAVIGIAGQTGDLAESLLKRQAGVKDSGSVVPGHGGVLDRIDALLFAFPAGYLMAAGLERFAT
jgi:phosphatidate cytidylyltransferase